MKILNKNLPAPVVSDKLQVAKLRHSVASVVAERHTPTRSAARVDRNHIAVDVMCVDPF